MGQGIEDSEGWDAVRRAYKSECDAEHNGKADDTSPWEQRCSFVKPLEVFVRDPPTGEPGTYRGAAVYWDHADRRMRLEYHADAMARLPDCRAVFQSGTLVVYGDSIPELRAIAERELPLLVAAIERRVKMAMGDGGGENLKSEIALAMEDYMAKGGSPDGIRGAMQDYIAKRYLPDSILGDV